MSADLGQEDVDLYSPAFQPKQGTRFALAHASFLPDAQAHQAILLSDSCVTATALAQGRERRRVAGRLLFAPQLAVHWTAYSTRRGPRAYERNTLKLAWLLSGGAQPTAEAENAADAIAGALDLAFELEGSDLEDVSAAEESVRLAGGNASELTPPLVEQIAGRLRQLADQATTAANELHCRFPTTR